MKIFIVLSESLAKSGTLPFTILSFQRYKVIKIGNMIEKMKVQHNVQLAMAKFAGQSKIVSVRPLLMILQ